ncbi:MAG: hypothetical protein P1U57_14765 [Oleibacter sp.]|nr:hypothetical protein [Thalassolituus sp.]
MPVFPRLVALSTVLFSSVFLTACGGESYTSAELSAMYPDISATSTKPEDAEILCPFQRLLKRSGILDDAIEKGSFEIRNRTLTAAAEVFGCTSVACGSAISYASTAQGNWRTIELDRLHEAGLLSHNCGLQFDFGGITVSDTRRAATLNRLAELAVDGRLVYEDLMTVKQETCDQEGVDMTVFGETEVKLIYAYLGGPERDYIEYSDVDKFFHATMPDYKATGYVNVSLIGQVQ